MSPTSAEATGGTQLILTVASIHPDSIAADVTVIFQQKAKQKCQQLQYNADAEVWYCIVTVPSSGGLTASTASDPSGIGIYTAQQVLAPTLHTITCAHFVTHPANESNLQILVALLVLLKVTI